MLPLTCGGSPACSGQLTTGCDLPRRANMRPAKCLKGRADWWG